MTELAFIIKGQTFLKAVAPLIYFARKSHMSITLLCYRSRPGKPYDNLDLTVIDRLLAESSPTRVIPRAPYRVVNIDGDANLQEYLTKTRVDAVICQDAQHHYPNILSITPVFSIAVFTDTLHYAAHHHRPGRALPYRTYWANEELRQRTEKLSGAEWPGAVLGSPMWDHWLWVDKNERFAPGSISFLTPPAELLDRNTLESLRELSIHVKKKGANFIYKDRPRFKWSPTWASVDQLGNEESGWPYTSMRLMCATDLHISSYSTAAFEAQWLGLPAINLPIRKGARDSIGNCRVKSYDLSVFESATCRTTGEDLIRAYEELIALPQAGPDITMADNHSISILEDVVRNIP
jgi:hypothetical protein